MTFNQWLQSRLTAHGYPVGPIDGVVGVLTIAALKAFQAARGLAVTGTADEGTVAALRTPSSRIPDDVAKVVGDRDTDPPVFDHVNNAWPRQSGVPGFYGAVGANQTRVQVPWDMVLAWNTSARIRSITLHKKVAASAERVMNHIADIYSAAEIRDLGLHKFGGSLNVRRIRGGSRYSMHSWGIAIDFDPERNQLKWKQPVARLSHDDAVPFWRAWEAEGWLSLGRARNYDWMHVQAARL